MLDVCVCIFCVQIRNGKRGVRVEAKPFTLAYLFIHSISEYAQVEYDLCHHICIKWISRVLLFRAFRSCERAHCVLRSSFFMPKCTCIYTILLLFIIFEHNTILLTPSSLSIAPIRAYSLSSALVFACNNPNEIQSPIFSFIHFRSLMACNGNTM